MLKMTPKQRMAAKNIDAMRFMSSQMNVFGRVEFLLRTKADSIETKWFPEGRSNYE